MTDEFHDFAAAARFGHFVRDVTCASTKVCNVGLGHHSPPVTATTDCAGQSSKSYKAYPSGLHKSDFRTEVRLV